MKKNVFLVLVLTLFVVAMANPMKVLAGRMCPQDGIGPGYAVSAGDYRIKNIGDYPMGWNYEASTGRWWYRIPENEGSILKDTDGPQWIVAKGTAVGLIYFFNKDGWMLSDIVKDGFQINKDGAVTYNGKLVILDVSGGPNSGNNKKFFLVDNLGEGYRSRMEGPYCSLDSFRTR